MDDELEIFDDTAVYKLKKPFKFGKEEIVREIKLKEPPAKEMSGIKLSLPAGDVDVLDIDVTQALKVIKVCCAEPPSKINLLKMIDITNCYATCLNLFFGDTD